MTKEEIIKMASSTIGGLMTPTKNVLEFEQERLRAMELMSNAPKTSQDGIPGSFTNFDAQQFAIRLEQQRKHVEALQLHDLDNSEKAVLEDHVKNELKWFKEEALTQDEMRNKPSGAPEKLLAFETKYGNRLRALKANLAHLYPGSDTATNLEQYRRKNGTSSH